MSGNKFFDPVRAKMEQSHHKQREKFNRHAPPRPVIHRPSDEEIHRQAFERMAAQPHGNLHPRRHDQPVFTIVPKPDRGNGPS